MAQNQPKRASKLAVVCYGLGDLASQFVWTYVGSYLTIFYTDVVGFAPVIVSAIMLIARIFDAVNDPMMGAVADNTRSKLGRFRPWIAFGCPVLAVFAVLTFVNFGHGTVGVLLSTLTYIFAGVCYTLVNIPYASLASVMTEDPKQRTSIGISRAVGMNLGMIIVNSCSAMLALKFSGTGAKVATGRGYFITAVIYSIISIPLFLAVFFTSKEVILPKAQAKRPTAKETIASMVQNKYLITISIVSIIQMVAFMGRISITAYYVIYCLGAFELIGLILTIPSIGGIIGSLLIAPFASKLGEKKALAITFIGQGIGLLIVYLSPFNNLPMVLFGHCIMGIFNYGIPISLAMVADCADYWEEKTGIRQDGCYYATSGLATKLGSAVGSAFGILLIARFGYVSGVLEQSSSTKAGINLTVNLLPAILLFVAAVVISILWDKSDSQFDEIRQHIKQKRRVVLSRREKSKT